MTALDAQGRRPVFRWAVMDRYESRLDGRSETIIWDGGMPLLFHRRDACRAYIKKRFGYIAGRKDLRAEPHGWRMPKPVRVRVVLEPVS